MKSLGFLEWLVIIAIVGVLASIVVVAISEKGVSEYKQCQKYEEVKLRNVPAKCVKYFNY